MGLFGAKKASHGTIHEVANMVERYFRGRGLDPDAHQLEGAEGYGWWLTEGSARIYVFVQDTATGPVLRLTSPLVHLPEENREAFYRHLLDINTDLSSCALSTHEDVVLVVAQRPTAGLTQEEVDSLAWNVAYVADTLDNKLADQFHARMYWSEIG